MALGVPVTRSGMGAPSGGVSTSVPKPAPPTTTTTPGRMSLQGTTTTTTTTPPPMSTPPSTVSPGAATVSPGAAINAYIGTTGPPDTSPLGPYVGSTGLPSPSINDIKGGYVPPTSPPIVSQQPPTLPPADPFVTAYMNSLLAQARGQYAQLVGANNILDINAAQQGNIMDLQRGDLWGTADRSLRDIAQQQYRDVDLARLGLANDQSRLNNTAAYQQAQGTYLNQLGNYYNTLDPLQRDTLKNAQDRALLQYNTDWRKAYSNAIAGGSVNAYNTAATRGELFSLLDLQRGSAQNVFARDQASLARDRASLDLQRAGLTKDQADLAVARKDLGIKNAELDSLAKSYGIRREDAEAALKSGLAKMGIDYDSFMDKMAAAKSANISQMVALGQSIYDQALQLASPVANPYATTPFGQPMQPKTGVS